MSKVLVIGSNYFEFNRSIADAFTELGWSVTVESYDNPIHPFKGWLKWRHKFSLNREKLKEKSRVKYKKYILEQFLSIHPDLVMIYNGEIFHSDTLDLFREKSKVAVWMLDSVEHFPHCRSHIDHVDAFFCFEKQDIEWYKQQNKVAHFLPQACDTSVYKSIPLSKDVDILFVGCLYRYKKRIAYLSRVVATFIKSKILIFGVYKPYYKNIIAWMFREKRAIYMNRNIPRDEVNAYYNRSKVVLNIHHEQSKFGANPKVFEISGSGAYQICDANPYIRSIFQHDEIGLYENEEELIACIDEALRNDKSDNALRAQQIVLSNHTFRHRIETIIEVMGLKNVR
jgi:spore maturation protein CgeB